MASKDPSNIDKHIGYKLKLRRVDAGMSQEALGERVGLSFSKFRNMKKALIAFLHLAFLNSHVYLKLISLISLKGLKPPAPILEWKTAPQSQNFLILSAAMKV